MKKQALSAAPPLKLGNKLIFQRISEAGEVIFKVKGVMEISTISDGRTRFLYEMEPVISGERKGVK